MDHNMFLVLWGIVLACILPGGDVAHISKLKGKGDPPPPADNIGHFWQVTDFHYDPKYSRTGVASQMCHTHWREKESLGEFGDYKCDAPWALVESAVSAMKTIESKPDFILWTGDSVPHVPDDTLSETENVNMIGKITTLLHEQFNKTTIFPSFGNHDPYPSNQMPFHSDKYFKDILTTSGWKTLLQDEAIKTFEKAGYYSTLLNAQLKVISLNTPLYYSSNHLTTNVSDPGDQFAWLQSELTLSRSRKEKVFIAGHVPPGVFGRVKDIIWMTDTFNKRLIEITQHFSDIIIAHLYGHEHTDGFRIINDDKGNPLTPVLLAPAVTPWNSTLAGAGYNNPAVRLFTYDRYTGALSDYQQYYLNLPDANHKGNATWVLEYSMSKDYGVKALTGSALNSLAKSFTEKGSANFNKYYKFNSVSSNNDSCSEDCKKLHLCAITQVDLSLYDKCVNPSANKEMKTTDIHSKTSLKSEKNKAVDSHSKAPGRKVAKIHSKTTPKRRSQDRYFTPAMLSDSPELLLSATHAIDNENVDYSHGHHKTGHRHHHKPPHPSKHPPPVKKFMLYIIIGLAVGVILLFILVMILCWRQRQMHLRLSNPRYMRAPTLTTKLLNPNSSPNVQYT